VADARPLQTPISGRPGLGLGAGLAVDQDWTAHALRRQQRGPQADEAALRHAAQDSPPDAEMVNFRR